MNKKIIDIISLSVVGVVVGGIALANLLQPNRPTVSVTENRQLAQMPEFSAESLADGSYFKGISTFISDTFLERDKLVSLSKKMDTLKGVDYKIQGADSFVLLDAAGNKTDHPEETAGSEADERLNAAFENLNKSPDTASSETASSETVPSWETEAADPAAAETGKTPSFVVGEIETEADDTDTAETEPAETAPPETAPSETAPSEAAPSEAAPVDTSAPEETKPSPVETETESAETKEPETETEPAEVEYYVNGLTLSKGSLKLTVGSGTVVYAYLDTNSPNPGNVKWSVSDGKIASIAVNPNGGIDVKGLAEGTCTLTCKYDDTIRASCEITVTSITAVTQTQNEPNADFLTDGMFIYGDAVHTQAFYSATNAKYYAQTAAYYKSLFGENVRMNVVVAPVSSIVVDNESVKSKIPDQKDIMDKMAALMDSSINFVDTYTPIYEHRGEYLYFKSDHHWTQRGAYYAYTAFAESVGLTPTPLSDFDYMIRNESYHGSMYMYTQDERVKYFTDVIEAFVSKKPHTMTVTGSNGATYHYDSTVVSTNNTYVTFIAGDNPYTVINVPENPQDFNVLVLKDSFGNAFVPFLCEHYGNIIVVDTRYSTFNIYDQLKDYGISDIIFVNNIQAANSYIWSKMYLAAVGVDLG